MTTVGVLREEERQRGYAIAKRSLDVVAAAGALLALSPLLFCVIGILSVTGEREIFFRQERIGRRQRPFGLLKFATMLRDSPKTGTITAANDPRILPIGKFLRATKINELPQLWNILRGEMSLVGPRPLTREAFAHYSARVQQQIAELKPGLTGVGSLILRNEEEVLAASPKGPRACYAEDVIPLKADLECWYSRHRSFGVDAKIIALTAMAVLRHRDRRSAAFLGIEPIVRRSSLEAELLPK